MDQGTSTLLNCFEVRHSLCLSEAAEAFYIAHDLARQVVRDFTTCMTFRTETYSSQTKLNALRSKLNTFENKMMLFPVTTGVFLIKTNALFEKVGINFSQEILIWFSLKCIIHLHQKESTVVTTESQFVFRKPIIYNLF